MNYASDLCYRLTVSDWDEVTTFTMLYDTAEQAKSVAYSLAGSMLTWKFIEDDYCTWLSDNGKLFFSIEEEAL